MLPVRWRSKARADLVNILEYIALRHAPAAISLQLDFERAVAQLPHHPYMYRRGRSPGTREMVVRSHYVVAYRVRATEIEIIAIRSTRQQ